MNFERETTILFNLITSYNYHGILIIFILLDIYVRYLPKFKLLIIIKRFIIFSYKNNNQTYVYLKHCISTLFYNY